jgi:hypothetical protein
VQTSQYACLCACVLCACLSDLVSKEEEEEEEDEEAALRGY